MGCFKPFIKAEIIYHMKQFIRKWLMEDGPSPSYPARPELDDSGESKHVPGLFLAGEVAGKPLIKVGLNEGYDLAERLNKKLDGIDQGSFDYDVAVVGGGVTGSATGVRLRELNRRVVIFEAGQTLQTLRTFTRGKIMLAEPESMALKGSIPFRESRVEQTLDWFHDALEASGVEIHEQSRVTDIKPLDHGQGFRIITEKGEWTAAFVVLCIGKSGHPRQAGALGEQEHRDKMDHVLSDPSSFVGKDILVYGGGDVAAEAALVLCDENTVTLATLDDHLIFPKKKNVDALQKKENEGRLTVLTGTRLLEIHENHVVLEHKNNMNRTSLPNHHVFEMIGSEPPRAFLKQIGIRFENQWTVPRFLMLGFTLTLCLFIYTWKKGLYPFQYYGQGLGYFTGIFKNPSFWYSAVYSFLMVYFGLKAMGRWSRAWTDKHQILRFSSLIIFQVLSFVLIECLFAIYLPPDTWWRAYAVSNPFPLLFDSFYNLTGTQPGDLKTIIAIMGAVMTFGVIPLFVRYHGKRFCSWICGCGGLAETLGDRWRHLSPKGERSRRWEIMGDFVLFWAFASALIILLVYDGDIGKSGSWHRAYALIVDFWLIAVIPMALYPIAGGKIWCRYWCPLAKYMEILSRWYGKLAIVSNDRCIQCTQCSYYCQVGVDVMAFARNGEAFSNKNSSCIHCGICISVCPMDVLSFKRE